MCDIAQPKFKGREETHKIVILFSAIHYQYFVLNLTVIIWFAFEDYAYAAEMRGREDVVVVTT